MDDDARNLCPRRRPRQRNGDDDERARFVNQAVPLGCRLMTEDRTGTGAKQRRPERRLPGGLSGEAGVDAALESLPAATTQTAAYRVRRDVGPGSLTAGYGTTLERQQINGPSGVSFGMRSLCWTCSAPASGRPEPVDNSNSIGLSVDN